MALKDIWKDIVEGDFIDPKQINDVAHGVIDNETRTNELENEINGENGWNEQAKAAAVIAEKAAKEAVSAKNQAVENASITTDKAQLATDKASEAAESADNASASEKTATDKAKEAGESANAAIEAKEAAEKARGDAENAADRAENATEFLKNGALFANALRGKLSGASVRADDVSPVEHELDVKVRSKNIITLPYLQPPSKPQKLNIVYGDDGGITISGKNTNVTLFEFDIFQTNILLTEDLFISGCPKGGSNDKYRIMVTTVNSNGAYNYFADNGDGLKINKGYTLKSIGIRVAAGYDLGESGVTFYPQAEWGTSATAYAPYIDVEGTKVTRLGKNFANLAGLPETKKYKAVTNTASGYEIDTKNNIIITTSPTEVGGYTYITTGINLSELCPEARVGMTLRFSAIDSYSEGASAGYVIIHLRQAAISWAFSGTKSVITITQKMLDSEVVIYASPTLNAVRTISNFQIELGDTATEYEPYRDSVEAIAGADGNVTGLMSVSPSMTIITDNGGAVIDCTYNRDANKVVTDLETKLNTLIATIGG